MEVLGRLQAELSSRYAIDREIGRGGMATVYLARDVRHERQVALKVLDPELGAVLGAERFLAEIKVTANLQHPNLLPLFDSGEADGLLFYVMPYVEGESLRARLDREKQLPVDEAVRIGVACANALDYAHQRGVIHRDLKPENILMQAGQPVIADFGIALAVSKAGGARITQTGLSLGTPQYMSPEQATGDRAIDGRTDIYSLAAIVYEMLTGEPPHIGNTSQAIIAKLMTEEPRPITTLRRNVPPHVNAAIRHALEKLPADRFATAHEFAVALAAPGTLTAADLAAGGGVAAAAGPGSSSAAPGSRWRHLAIPLLAVVALLSLGIAGWSLARGAAPSRVTRFGIAFSDDQEPNTNSEFALSPDGSLLAYIGPSGTGSQLWLKARDRYSAAPVRGTANARTPTFSPDGQWIAFVQANQLKKIPVTGGAALTLADTVANRGLAWLDDGTIVFAVAGGQALRRVAASGPPASGLWRSDSAVALSLVKLPGSRGVLFARCRGGACDRELDLWVVDPRSAEAHRLVSGAAKGYYSPTGHLVYVRRDGAALAVEFNLRTLTVSGAAVPVLDSVAGDLSPALAMSAEGSVVMRSGRSSFVRASHNLVWVDRTGRETPVDSSWSFQLTVSGLNRGWSLSPDGKRVAIGLNTDAGDDIWIKQLPRGPLSRLSFDSAAEHRPRWSHDGRSVTFLSARTGALGVVRRSADGTGQDELVQPARGINITEFVASPDGQWMLFRTGGTQNTIGGRDILAMRVGTDTAPKPLLASNTADESAIALSPDGRWIAYQSTETGHTEVYVRPFPNVDAGKWQVSASGGTAPLWARNGREVFFVNSTRDMVAVPVTVAGASLQLGERKTLFHLRDEFYLTEQENYTPFDISPDGQRFLMARQVRAAERERGTLLFVDNWFEELRQKMKKK